MRARIRGRSKYRAIPTRVDGVRFASKAEASRFVELKLLEKAGKIEELELQPRFPLRVILSTGTVWGALAANQEPIIGTYVADFAYRNEYGERIVEDVKGFKTPLYRWKKKHVEAQYGITITEVTR